LAKTFVNIFIVQIIRSKEPSMLWSCMPSYFKDKWLYIHK